MEYKQEFINGQDLPPYRNMKYMHYDFGRSGCGPIAVYNLLTALGDTADIEDIVRYCEKYSLLTLNGLFGTSNAAIVGYLKKKGYNVKMRMYPTTENVERATKEKTASILSYFHGKGSHYITLHYNKYGDGRMTAYNSTNKRNSENTFPSMNVYKMNRKVFIPLAVITAEKRS